MNRKILIIAGFLAAVTLLGAGCAGTEQKEENKDNSAPIDLNVNDNQNEETTGLALSVEALGEGKVKVNWSGAASEGGWRLMHSGKELPNENAYWQWLSKGENTYEWSGVPAGKRYFRVCAWDGEKCGTLSNELQIEVK